MSDPHTSELQHAQNPAASAPPIEAPSPGLVLAPAPAGATGNRTSRETKFIVNEAFSQSLIAISYYVSQRLAELFPEKAVVETLSAHFDPIWYASHGHCHAQARSVPHPHWVLGWEESRDSLGKIKNRSRQAWFDIEWQDERLEVFWLHFSEGHSQVRHSFIIADTRETAVRFLRTVCTWNAEPRDELLVFSGHHWHKDEDLFRAIKDATLENLVLPAGMTEGILEDTAGFFAAEPTYRRFAVPWKRGVLFSGPPGNGKTHAVKGLVNRLGKRCLYVKSFRGHGPSEEGIAEVFEKARRCAPCVLVLEDLDSLVTKENRSFFLNEMDGFAGNDGILTLATTNHPERLDPAITERPSRFDRTYRFELPARPERQAYVARWSASLEEELRVSSDVAAEVAEFTDGFSYAYLKELCLSALIAWMRAQEPGGMAPVLRQQTDLLRRQMKAR